MNSELNLTRESKKTLARLLPRIQFHLESIDTDANVAEAFVERLTHHWQTLFGCLYELYGHRYDFFYHLEESVKVAAHCWSERDETLKTADHRHELEPDWFHSQTMVGGALYVDLFSENLAKLREHVGYFQKMGLTYVHLMPLFAVRQGDSDGGYAVSNYRSVEPSLGSMDELKQLASELRAAGITLVLDFVFNHTSDDHTWAKHAQSGDPEYEDYYYLFPDRILPNAYDAHLREIFPTVRRGNFSWHEGMQRWVWTTFNSFQWDLNYSNPAVFTAMLGEMLFIANAGVDILRLDAVAFIWKEMGTGCENLPKAHTLIRAFNAMARIAAPSLLFKSEAIVHPDEVIRYIDKKESQLSYNPLLMALLWESLATREVRLLSYSLNKRFKISEGCLWCNYLRCHDDIGWTFDDGDAAHLGINAYDHRKFLNEFYTGQFKGSFARGVPFQYNPDTGDMRISGTLASLAGLEHALDCEDEALEDMAVRRIILLHSILFSIGGIPLLYLGEEWGILNNYDYIKDPAKAGDSRWIHRPKMKWEFLENPQYAQSVHRRIFDSINRLIAIRKDHPALRGMDMEIMGTGNDHVLGYVRKHEGSRLNILANFSDIPQSIEGNHLRTHAIGRYFKDIASDKTISAGGTIELEPYQFLWLERE